MKNDAGSRMLARALLSVALLVTVWWAYGSMVAMLLGLLGQMTGVLVFFPALYSLYVSELVGYHYLRNLMHPRRPDSHSLVSLWKNDGICVYPVPILNDNYAYIVWCEHEKEAAVIDPADPKAVWHFVEAFGLKLTTLITTHKHWDHAGGNKELLELCPGLRVIGSAEDAPHCLSHPVGEGDAVKIGRLDVSFKLVPGHTRGHILTLVSSPQSPRLVSFSGDSLFCCGVGAFFEAYDPADLRKTYNTYHSLPNDTVLFPGHEYSELLSNQALSCDPSNRSLRERSVFYQRKRLLGESTIPSSIGTEKEVNPFLRIPRDLMNSLSSASSIQGAMYAPHHHTQGHVHSHGNFRRGDRGAGAVQ
ncbi:Hydroxyacylglutathione hydrolase [Diplonema papillatum]|nr:Hydroxyacylglutathione hydrolase [Diplonema papillatum]